MMPTPSYAASSARDSSRASRARSSPRPPACRCRAYIRYATGDGDSPQPVRSRIDDSFH